MLKFASLVSGVRVANSIRNVKVQPALGIVRGVPAVVLDLTSHKNAPCIRILYVQRVKATAEVENSDLGVRDSPLASVQYVQVATKENIDPGVRGSPLVSVKGVLRVAMGTTGLLHVVDLMLVRVHLVKVWMAAAQEATHLSVGELMLVSVRLVQI